ncbi:MAG: YifB family Mg chelatase-like AAA ATPase [Thermovirgaceae bacterium]
MSAFGVTLQGIEARKVEVEVEITGGLFSISVVGLPDASVREARERVRAALRSAGMPVRGRVAINLAPADVPKEGALLDLPMALGIARAMGEIPPVEDMICMGELALDGRIRRVRGAVPAALLAKRTGLPIFVPEANAREVSLVSGVRAYAVSSLERLFSHLRKEAPLEPVVGGFPKDEKIDADPDLADIKGQAQAKRALEIAAAGGHNIIFIGSPGSGKTMLARSLRGLLPPLSDEEVMETLLVRSTVGLPPQKGRTRPFRTIHHTATTVSVCGGGATLKPGEVSLAHRGVLFLDEFTEFRRDLLEALRQPLEDGRIVVSRASGSVTYPARVLLAAACNPCPCGYYGDPVVPCRCPASAVERYQRKLSGPIIDRLDLHISVPRLTPEELVQFGASPCESSASVRERVTSARRLQQERWSSFGFASNAELPEKVLKKHIGLAAESRRFIQDAAGRLRLSGRGLSRVLKVARTIADLGWEEQILPVHLSEALAYREGANMPWTG